MSGGRDLQTVMEAGGFLPLIGVAVLPRHRLNRALAALPEETRERLGLIKPDDVCAHQHRRVVARRLLLRGLPGRVPLGEEVRRDLFGYRAFGPGAAAYRRILRHPTACSGDIQAASAPPIALGTGEPRCGAHRHRAFQRPAMPAHVG